MADGTASASADGAPAAPEAQPQAGTQTSQTSGSSSTGAESAAPQAGAGDGTESLSLDEARKLRQEAHSLRQRLAQAEKRVKEHDDAQLSDRERLEKRVAELEESLTAAQAAARDKALRLLVEREARAQKFVDEDAAVLLLPSVGAVEFDDDTGEPKNVKALLKKLAEQKPYLVARDSATATAQPAPQAPQAGAALPGTPRPDSARPLAEAELARLRAATDHRARSYL